MNRLYFKEKEYEKEKEYKKEKEFLKTKFTPFLILYCKPLILIYNLRLKVFLKVFLSKV